MSKAAKPPGTQALVITIDGPAGAGKSTVAKLLAKALGLMYLDTGATYRTLAYAAHQAGVVTDVERVVALAKQLPIEFQASSDSSQRVLLGGEDVSTAIRSERVTEAAALISQYPEVRSAMVDLQRRLASRQGVVVEGRDTGSVVFPDASYKFFLDAPQTIRAKRRQQELSRLYGSEPPLAQVTEQLEFRDGLDRTRRVGPLVKPSGAVTIDTGDRTTEQVVEAMLRHISSKPQPK